MNQREFEVACIFNGITLVPRTVAECPECGAKLRARSHAWDEESGRPLASELQIDCVKESGRRPHRWWQSDWQPVIDAVRKHCNAIEE